QEDYMPYLTRHWNDGCTSRDALSPRSASAATAAACEPSTPQGLFTPLPATPNPGRRAPNVRLVTGDHSVPCGHFEAPDVANHVWLLTYQRTRSPAAGTRLKVTRTCRPPALRPSSRTPRTTPRPDLCCDHPDCR